MQMTFSILKTAGSGCAIDFPGFYSTQFTNVRAKLFAIYTKSLQIAFQNFI